MKTMDIESLIVGLYCDAERPETPPALDLALKVAGLFGARVTAEILVPKVVAPGGVAPGVVSGFIAAEADRLAQIAERRALAFREAVAAAGIDGTVSVAHLEHWALREAFTRQARAFDLAVLSGGEGFYDQERNAIEGALFGSGRPLLVAGSGPATLEGPVIVAWDGSGRAARAVHDALPFLRRAPAVILVSVQGDKDLSQATDPGAMLAHLARHGVTASARTVPTVDGSAAEALRREAAASGAGLIVMGSFVHSKLYQIVFGGVTGALLSASAVPLLLSY